MRVSINLFLSLIIALGFTFTAFAGDECEGECGNLCLEGVKFKMQGNFQTMLMAKIAEDDSYGPNDEFKMGRARLIFKGEVLPKKFYFYTQFEMYSGTPLRDFKFIYAGLPYRTYVSFGRMKPNFTYYMPRNTARLDFIHYPLMVQHLGMDWQMGVQTTTKFSIFKMNLGIFNGQDIPNNFADNNKYKDYFFRLDANPEIAGGKAQAGIYYWDGTATNDFFGVNMLADTINVGQSSINRLGFLLGYERGPITVKGEYIIANDDYASFDENASSWEKSEAERSSYYIQAGYKFLDDKLEFLVRYEMYDQNKNESDATQTWTTLGLNYYLNSWKTMLYLNYIMKDTGNDYKLEQSSPINYREGKNDLIVLQAQMAF